VLYVLIVDRILEGENMGSEYKRAVEIMAPMEMIHDSCIKYFQSIGYQMTNDIPPSRIEFSKKGTIWTTDDIEIDQTLSVYLNKSTKGVVANFSFFAPMATGQFTSRSQSIANSEIEALCGLIYSANPTSINNQQDRICVECKKKIPWDANLCPYCGHDFSNKQESKDIFCPYCGGKNNPDYNFCIKCKKSLSEVK